MLIHEEYVLMVLLMQEPVHQQYYVIGKWSFLIINVYFFFLVFTIFFFIVFFLDVRFLLVPVMAFTVVNSISWA